MAGGSWEVRSDDGLGRTHHLEADHSQVGPIPQLGRPVSRIMPLSCQSAPRLNDSPPRRAQALDRARAAQVNDIFEEDPYASAADAAVLHSLQQGMALAQGRICRVDKLPCPGEVLREHAGPRAWAGRSAGSEGHVGGGRTTLNRARSAASSRPGAWSVKRVGPVHGASERVAR
jgi:hypothetical protein